MKKEIASVYYIRIMAMLMVVLVHTTAQFRHLFEVGTAQHEIYHFINNIVRVETGMFIMLVGLVFFYNYRDRKLTKDVFFSYWKKRVTYILIPYIAWSLIYEIQTARLEGVPLDWASVREHILTGGSHYQLWFIFLVVQFYLVFPLVLVIVKRSAFLRKYMWLFGFLAESLYFVLNQEYRLTSMPFFMNYFGSFAIGAWIGLNYEAITVRLKGWKVMLAGAGFLLCGVPYVYIRYHNAFDEPVPIDLYSYRLLGIGFLIVGSLFFFLLSEKLTDTFSAETTNRIKHVAYYSFGYYLIHPLVLYYVMEWLPTRETGLSYHLMILLQYTVTVILCYFIIWFFHRFVPLASFLFGKLPKKSPLFWDGGLASDKQKADSSPNPLNR